MQKADFINSITEVRGTKGEEPNIDASGTLLNPRESGKYGKIVAMSRGVLSANTDTIRIKEELYGNDPVNGEAGTIYKTIKDIDARFDTDYSDFVTKYNDIATWAHSVQDAEAIMHPHYDEISVVNNDLLGNDTAGNAYPDNTSKIVAVGTDVAKGVNSTVVAVGEDLLAANGAITQVVAIVDYMTSIGEDLARTGTDRSDATTYSHIRNAAANSLASEAAMDKARIWAEGDNEIVAGSYSSKYHANRSKDAREASEAARDASIAAKDESETARDVARGYVDQIHALDADAVTLDAGRDATAEYNDTTGILKLGLPRGQKGEVGPAFTVDRTGMYSDRAQWDDRATGFSFLSLDGYGPQDEDTVGTNFAGTLTIASGSTLNWDGSIDLHTDYMYVLEATGMTAGSIALKDGTHTIITISGNGEQVRSFRTRINDLSLVADGSWDGDLTISIKKDLSQNAVGFFKKTNTLADWTSGSVYGKGERGDVGTSIADVSFTSTTDASGVASVVGATDTYTITSTDGATSTFNVVNGTRYTDVEVQDAIKDAVMTLTHKTIVDDDSDIAAKRLRIKVKPTSDILRGDVIRTLGYDATDDCVTVEKVSSIDQIAMGMMKADTLANDVGYAYVNDLVPGIDTSTFSVNDVVYSDGLGALTNVKDVSKYQQVGIVLTSDANGWIQFKCATQVRNLDGIDLTSDADKPISTATQAALDDKLDRSQLSVSDTLGVDDTKIPSQKAVKVYVDAKVSTAAGGMKYIGGYNASTHLPRLEPLQLTGDVDPDGTTTLIGTGTLFSTELVVGDNIEIDGETRSVDTIESDTKIIMNSSITDKASGQLVNRLPVDISKGDMYTVTVAGQLHGEELGVGDMVFAEMDAPTVADDWTMLNRSVGEQATDIPVVPGGELTSTNVQNALEELQADITTNLASITTNIADIATNTTDIATNVTNITTNTNDITANEADITLNRNAITANTTDIATNRTDIDANKVLIDKNILDIAANKVLIDANTVIAGKNSRALGTEAYDRYDLILSGRNVIEMTYTADDDLDVVRYTGDGGNSDPYFRDVMEYDANGDLIKVKHFCNTTDTTTESGKTELTYNAGVLVSSTYTE